MSHNMATTDTFYVEKLKPYQQKQKNMEKFKEL